MADIEANPTVGELMIALASGGARGSRIIEQLIAAKAVLPRIGKTEGRRDIGVLIPDMTINVTEENRMNIKQCNGLRRESRFF